MINAEQLEKEISELKKELIWHKVEPPRKSWRLNSLRKR